MFKGPEEIEEGLELTFEDFFQPCFGTVTRCNHPEALEGYKREWETQEYYIKIGKHKGKYLSQVHCAKWLKWALNHFFSELPPPLRRALIDQYNYQFL